MADKKFENFTDGGEVRVGDIVVGLRSSDLTRNFQFDFPGIGIKDSSGNYLFQYATVGSAAVNYPKLINAFSLNDVVFTAGGTDSNINVSVQPKGTGRLILDELNWPTADGAAGTFMYTDGAGNLGFTTGVATSITGTANQVLVNGTSGTPQTGAVTLTTPQNIATTSSPTFSNLKLTGANILDTNNNTILNFVATTSAINYITIKNNSVGVAPEIGALGTDTNIGMTYRAKATGAHTFISTNTTVPVVWLSGTTSQHTTSWNVPNTATSRTITLQDASGTMAYLSDITGSGVVSPGTANQIAYYATTGSTVSGLTSANNGLLVTSNTGVPSILAGSGVTGNFLQSNASGAPSWSSSTLILGGNFTMSGSFTFTGTVTGNTAVTFPTSGTLATTSQIPTGAALTRVDDTNITLTLGGSPTTALVNATSITAGWTGQLAVPRGGTGAATLTGLLTGNGTSAITGTAITQYSVLTGGASNAPNSVAPSATSGIPFISQGSSAQPIFGTAVVAGGGTGNTTFTAYSVICAGTTATGAFQNAVGVGNSGEVFTSNGAGMLPSWQAGGGGGSVTVEDIQNETFLKGSTTNIGNDYSLTLDNPISSYVAGQLFLFTPGADNTNDELGDVATLDVDGLGAQILVIYSFGTTLIAQAGVLIANNTYQVLYDGSQFIVLNPASLVIGQQITNQSWTYAIDTGAADDYILTIPTLLLDPIGGLLPGVKVSFKATNTNTGASTLTINALSPFSIVNNEGTALSSGNIVANSVYELTYDGSSFVLLNPTVGGGGGGTAVSTIAVKTDGATNGSGGSATIVTGMDFTPEPDSTYMVQAYLVVSPQDAASQLSIGLTDDPAFTTSNLTLVAGQANMYLNTGSAVMGVRRYVNQSYGIEMSDGGFPAPTSTNINVAVINIIFTTNSSPGTCTFYIAATEALGTDILNNSVCTYTLLENGAAGLVGVTQADVQGNIFNTGTDTGMADAYDVAVTPAITTPYPGMLIAFSPANANNTTTPTLALNGGTPLSIYRFNGAQPEIGDISGAVPCFLVADAAASSWQLINPNSVGLIPRRITQGSYTYCTDSGMADAYEASSLLSVAPVPGTVIYLDVLNSNTGASTFNFNGGGAVAITYGGSALIIGQMIAGSISQLCYSAANEWNLINSYL